MSEKGAGGLVEAMVCFCRTVRSPGFCPLSEFSPLRAPVLQRPFSFFDKRREAGGGGPDLHASAAAAGSEPRPKEMKRCLFCLHQIHALSFLRPRPRVKPACLRMLFTPSELRSRLGSMSGSPQQPVSLWSLRPWCAGARVWVLWTPVPRRVRDSLQLSRVQTLRASSRPSGGLSCILTTWSRFGSSPPSVKSPSGPTLGGGCSAALEARRAQLSLPSPDTPPARSALPGVFSLRSHRSCHGVSASWPSMDAGHMHSPWVASGPQGDLDSH